MGGLRIAIAIDELFGSVPGGGGQGRVIVNLIRELAQIDSINSYTLFSARRITSVPEAWQSLPGNFRLAQVPCSRPQLMFLAWHTLRWPPIENFIGPQDVVHATSPSAVPACRAARLVVTVHDLVWWRFPEGLRPWGRFFQRTGLRIGAREAYRIVTDSEATRREVLRCVSITPERVCPVSLAAAPNFGPVREAGRHDAVCRKYGITGRYLLSLGTLEPRKNYLRLLQAYAALSAELRREHQLVLVGAQGWKMPDIRSLSASLGLGQQVIWTEHVPDHDVQVLLSGATLFIYPSLYEGFGLPVLEAMACEVPVITSNAAALPEVAGESAWLVDPTSIEAIAGAMTRLLTEARLRHDLIERGRVQSRRFSFRTMAEKYLAIYAMR